MKRTAAVGLATALLMAVVVVIHLGGISALASGGDGSYTFLSHQPDGSPAPVTYSSCRRVTVEFNLNGVGEKDKTREILLQAMGEASAASHLNLVYAGDSIRRPRPGGATMEGYPVLIAFSDATEYPTIEHNAGLGGSAYVEQGKVRTYVSGQIVLEKQYWNSYLDSGRDTSELKAIAMHELGHVLGLGHVHDKGELMNADNIGRLTYGPGDRKGLAIAGRGACT